MKKSHCSRAVVSVAVNVVTLVPFTSLMTRAQLHILGSGTAGPDPAHPLYCEA
jgi:hypothetical protein